MKRVFKVTANTSDNWLWIRYVEHVDADDVQACLHEIENILPGLKSGFSLIADLSGLHSMSIECAPYLGKIMDRCKESKVGRVIRVIPDPAKDIGFKILSVFHYGNGVPIRVAGSLEEAEKILKFRLSATGTA